MTSILQKVVDVLNDTKAININAIPVSNLTPLTDYMIIATGTSTTHIHALADRILKSLKSLSLKPKGIEGKRGEDWILIDLGDIVVHLMLPQARDFYNLDKLWALNDFGENNKMLAMA